MNQYLSRGCIRIVYFYKYEMKGLERIYKYSKGDSKTEESCSGMSDDTGEYSSSGYGKTTHKLKNPGLSTGAFY